MKFHFTLFTLIFLLLLLVSTTPTKGQTLTTQFNDSNDGYGNMFDVEVLQPITINDFTVQLDATGGYTVEVFYKKCSYIGSETTAGDWNSLGSATFVSSAANSTQQLGLNLTHTIHAGTHAFAIFGRNSRKINYTTGSNEGAVTAADANLRILEGIGISGINAFGGPIRRPRIWNGTIHYSPSTSPCRVIAVSETENVCVDGTTELSDWKARVEAANTPLPTELTGGPLYSGVPICTAGFPATITANATYDGNDCDSEMELYYAYYTCTIDGSFIDAGSLTLTLYPDLTSQTYVTSNANGCCPTLALSMSSACDPAMYTIKNNIDGNTTGMPDCATAGTGGEGMVTFTITHADAPNACQEVIMAPYTCIICPTVDVNVNSPQSICGQGSIDFTAAEATIDFTDLSDRENGIRFWLQSGTTPQDAAPASVTYEGDGCAPDVRTIYAYVECDIDDNGSTDSYVAAGSFEVTIYPDLTEQHNVFLADGGCCPSLQLDCSSGYKVTNTYDSNGATPDCSAETGQGTIVFTVSDEGDNCSTTYTAAYNCLCPSILTAIVDTQYLCQTGALDSLQAVQTGDYRDDNNTLAGIGFWLDNTHPPTQAVPESLTYAGNGCDPDTIRLYGFVQCDENQDGFTGATDDSYIAAGQVMVVLFPDISQQTNIIVEEGSCCPSLSLACPNYTVDNTYDSQGPTPDCSAELSNGTIDFRITHPLAPDQLGLCWQDTITATFDCRVCPEVGIPLVFSDEYCQATSFDYPSFTNMVTITDPSNTSLGISYWMDSTATMAAPTDFTYSADGCTTQADTIYALLACDLDQDGTVDEWLPAGTITFQLFPDLSLIPVENADNCCPFLATDCTIADGFLMTNTYDNQGASPDCSNEFGHGLIRFIILNQNAPEDFGSCTTRDITTAYDCRICPTVTTAVNWSETFCVTGTPNYNGAAATVEIDNPSNTSGGLRFWLDDTYTIPAPERLTHTGNNQCAVETIPIYANLICDRNQDGVVDEQFPAGDFTVTLYPAPQAPIIDRILVADEECQYQVVPACPADVLSTPTFGPLPVVSFAGTTEIAVTSGLDGSPCPEETFTVDYPACSICPFEINIMAEELPNGTPFYNTTVLQITGALPPLQYEFDFEGYFNRTIRPQEDPIGALITLQYSNGSSWAVTVTDDDGCVGTFANNDNNNELLDIDAAIITPSSSHTADDGSIDLTVSGGTPPYAYAWYGPLGFTATTADVSGLHYGWHQVIVTDNSIPQQQQKGFYWIPAIPQQNNGGYIRGKGAVSGTPFLQVHPNPIQDQAVLTFGGVDNASQVQLTAYTVQGQQVANIYTGTVATGNGQQVDWSIGDLPAGLYFVQLSTDKGIREQLRIVVVK